MKAAVQNAIARLPGRLSYATYYRLQRIVGGLRTTNPLEHLAAGVATWQRILRQDRNPVDKVFFEVGTGREPLVPLSYWLMGARRTITIDVNPYVKSELVRESLAYVADHRSSVEALFGDLLDRQRMDTLLQFFKCRQFSLRRFLKLCRIDCVQQSDTTKVGLNTASVDFHTSYTVFEHIPPNVLVQILKEGNRIVHDDGLFVHMIDYSDHFSHSDGSISAINFLQYSDADWSSYAGNRYMYMNRLRHDDVIALFQQVGHRIVDMASTLDERALDILRNRRISLDQRFSTKSLDVLATRGAWIVSRKEVDRG